MKSTIARTILTLCACAAVTATVRAEAGSQESMGAYLFAHFIGESPMGEQIYFSVSTNGLDWTDLNNSTPVLISDLGEKGVRDPAIIRSADGKKFYVLATDLRIASGRGWDAARFEGSHSLIFWESEDLINWSKPWSVDVSGAIPGAGCTWAPEAFYDETTGDYVVYWATIAPKDGVKEARIYTAKTKDFRTFTPAELYIERVGKGVDRGDIIDTQIIEVADGRYKYYRVSRDSQITVEGADSLFGEWMRIGDISRLGYTARDVEGPIIFQFNNEQKWCLLVDRYAKSGGYLPLVTTNLSDPSAFRVLKPKEYSLGDSLKRHGGILNITQAEYDALVKKWPSVPLSRIESAADEKTNATGTVLMAAPKVPTEKDMAAYLMVYFSDADHSLHMALSTDGYSFTALNNAKPVIDGKEVALQKGIRDPHISRGPDGAFYLAMTDLHIFAQKAGFRDTEWERDGKVYDWGNNRGFVLMKSKDLIHWSRTNLRVDQAFPGLEEIGCAWAPETIYDAKKGKMMLYYTMRFKNGKNRLYYTYMNDAFTRMETVPELLFEYPKDVSYIDADITKIGDQFHMYYTPHDGGAGVKHAVSSSIHSGYVYEPDWVDPEPKACEAPNLWKRIGEDKWVLMYDVYGVKPHNFGFSETTDFKTYTNLGHFNGGVMKATNFSSPKHAAVIHLTKQEADRLAAHWKLENF